MTTIKGSAPAKVNLTLHVTGQRSDGYHLLDSLVGFAGVFDEITVTMATELSLTVTGPFAQGVPTNESNLMMRAARLLQAAAGVTAGAAMTLEKNLPHAAGIGSGSSDAAMTLAVLAQLWDVPPLSPEDPSVLALGADVPVCIIAPHPLRMEGIGEILSPTPPLPSCAMILVTPKVAVPTGPVFAGLTDKQNPKMAAIPAGLDFMGFSAWLASQRNDLAGPACALAPDIGAALTALGRQPLVSHAGMSGSGATCYGLTRTMGDARQVARALQIAHMDWWVVPAELL
ncbi:MAG: 4-(cytidine 5'-diphospho)-2-C-methyl-D-erythritol kinase [Yoonia sp.]|nr:4-(cytidine 5'-diphospho)-2-C-methyl-D-erythritol kinase [Yoonia sp.]